MMLCPLRGGGDANDFLYLPEALPCRIPRPSGQPLSVRGALAPVRQTVRLSQDIRAG